MTARVHRDVEVRLADLADGGRVEGERFEACVIVGPALVVLSGGSLSGCVFEGEPAALFRPLAEDTGVIELRECAFDRCRFRQVVVAYTREQEGVYRAAFDL